MVPGDVRHVAAGQRPAEGLAVGQQDHVDVVVGQGRVNVVDGSIICWQALGMGDHDVSGHAHRRWILVIGPDEHLVVDGAREPHPPTWSQPRRVGVLPGWPGRESRER